MDYPDHHSDCVVSSSSLHSCDWVWGRRWWQGVAHLLDGVRCIQCYWDLLWRDLLVHSILGMDSSRFLRVAHPPPIQWEQSHLWERTSAPSEQPKRSDWEIHLAIYFKYQGRTERSKVCGCSGHDRCHEWSKPSRCCGFRHESSPRGYQGRMSLRGLRVHGLALVATHVWFQQIYQVIAPLRER